MKRISSIYQILTESSRLMRGASEHICEYLLELHTEMDIRVGCDGYPHVRVGEYHSHMESYLLRHKA